MKTIRIAINGFGRIGRCFLRSLFELPANVEDQYCLQVVAINELADCATIAHLFRYDSTHGRFPGAVSVADDVLTINGQRIQVLHLEHIDQLPWRQLDIDLVLECTGRYSERADANRHLQAGAKRVLFSHPARSQEDVDATIVYGLNHQLLNGSQKVVSNASCSTNCIVPVIDTLHSQFGIEQGVITTIHSAMNDQPVIDAYHHTDLRKTRSAFQSIIPVETGLAQGIDRLLPALAGRFEAQAMRVPTINVSAIDLSVTVSREVSAAQVNKALQQAATGKYRQVLAYTEEALASCDFNHDPHSGIVDASQTRVAGKRLVKVLTWFDNEWGYANRMLDVIKAWAPKLAA